MVTPRNSSRYTDWNKMKEHISGFGNYGYSYEIEIDYGNGKVDQWKYIYLFQDEKTRDISMGHARRGERTAKKWKKLTK
jgi:hypothetical protein